jgi:hypothetical protein
MAPVAKEVADLTDGNRILGMSASRQVELHYKHASGPEVRRSLSGPSGATSAAMTG